MHQLHDMLTDPGRPLDPNPSPQLWWQVVLASTCAGAMGWGIRGQYGHETGAMIAGLLVGLVLAQPFARAGSSLQIARAVAWCTIAIGFGGSMTYGQTIGLTQQPELVGNWAALRWGLLGLAMKGGLWIGFAGAFLGMGLGGVRYGVKEIAGIMVGLLILNALGIWCLNEPFFPADRVLPRLYFSADWYWQPEADLKPRREVWGGLLLGLVGLIVYTRCVRGDRLAARLAVWGILGGVCGFPGGQCLQAVHAWNPEWYRQGIWATLDPYMNWWNWMETTFGAVMGAALAVGLWRNRTLVAVSHDQPSVAWSPVVELGLFIVHVFLLIGAEFASIPVVEELYDQGLILAFIPIVAVTAGRYWPYLIMLPVTCLPIAGKTVRTLVYKESVIGEIPGWLLFGVLPCLVTLIAAWFLARRTDDNRQPANFLRPLLIANAWLYFALNWAVFHAPWPWEPWSVRTPNGLVFAVCLLVLTLFRK